MTRLHLVRHGETPWNAEQRLQGQEDIGLSEVGELQARSLRATLAAVLGEALGAVSVVRSPLARARRTCELLGLEADVVDDRWQEAHLGDWTGRTRAELVAAGDGAYAAWRAGRLSPPGAESTAAVRERVGQALASLPDAAQVVVVTHGGPIRAVCDRLLGLTPAQLVPVQPGSLTVIELGTGGPRLEYFNLTPVLGHVPAVEAPD